MSSPEAKGEVCPQPLAVVLSGCGSDTKTATSSSSSTESSKSTRAIPAHRRSISPSPKAGRLLVTGDVDPQKLIDVAGGELNNLPGGPEDRHHSGR
jgi:hypothetical protein